MVHHGAICFAGALRVRHGADGWTRTRTGLPARDLKPFASGLIRLIQKEIFASFRMCKECEK